MIVNVHDLRGQNSLSCICPYPKPYFLDLVHYEISSKNDNIYNSKRLSNDKDF